MNPEGSWTADDLADLEAEVGLELYFIAEDDGDPYTVLTDCIETLSYLLGCYHLNPSVQDFFLQTHGRFFLTCSEDELLLTDAPHNVVVVLTLVPVTLLPLLVYLVVWKSNRRE
ncbi:hypothetical protein NHX12_025203 [Muraenolepis orangiensis]|uniref:Uncharacterized protein n=1 Tax=Muraenolepis orangiensis TaxID=630683 RepID=A0A9Q0EKS3_9TELE|nr:hypothetical protein NHX12_025203 [Muraenolepis orangiensis]